MNNMERLHVPIKADDARNVSIDEGNEPPERFTSLI